MNKQVKNIIIGFGKAGKKLAGFWQANGNKQY